MAGSLQYHLETVSGIFPILTFSSEPYKERIKPPFSPSSLTIQMISRSAKCLSTRGHAAAHTARPKLPLTPPVRLGCDVSQKPRRGEQETVRESSRGRKLIHINNRRRNTVFIKDTRNASTRSPRSCRCASALSPSLTRDTRTFAGMSECLRFALRCFLFLRVSSSRAPFRRREIYVNTSDHDKAAAWEKRFAAAAALPFAITLFNWVPRTRDKSRAAHGSPLER
jgi:hypothetical protein